MPKIKLQSEHLSKYSLLQYHIYLKVDHSRTELNFPLTV